jgi:hypothetical protein
MTPVAKNRNPAPYREKGQPKTRAVKFVVTEDEMQALEILCKDWNISIAQSVRTMIGLSSMVAELKPIFEHPKGLEILKKQGINPALLEWRLITLKRFSKYWNKGAEGVNNL